MAAAVNPSLAKSIGNAGKIYDIFYLWGFTSAFVIYCGLSKLFPASETLIPASIHEDPDVISAADYKGDIEHHDGSGDDGEKGFTTKITEM